LGEAAGSAADFLNQLAAKVALTGMTDHVPGLDLQRFVLLSSETGVPNEAGQQVLAKLPCGHPKVLALPAFDLEGGKIVAKAYYNPGLKALLTGEPTKAIVLDAIRKFNGPHGSYSAGVQAVDDYLASFGDAEEPQMFLLANDCVVDSPASRLKVYVSTPITTLAAA
jgi:DMATS type aromatic prenyltransferase